MDPLPDNINDITTISQLIESGTNINKKYEDDITLLHFAAFCGRIAIVKYLVDSGASVDIIGKCGRTPLQMAIWPPMTLMDDRVNTIQYLLDHGASKDYMNDDGENAIDIALKFGNNEIAQFIESYDPVPTKGVYLDDDKN